MVNIPKLIDNKYLKYVRERGCIIPLCRYDAQADHLVSRTYKEARRNDFTCVGLCQRHHREREQIGIPRFEEKHQVNLWKEALLTLATYLGKIKQDDSLGLD